MSRLISFFKNLPIVRILTVFCATTLLFFATACQPSSSVQAKAAPNSNKPIPEQYVPKNAVMNPYEGGMNQYSDVDPRANTEAVDAKAKFLEKRAEQNLDKMVDSPQQYVRNYRSGTPLGERIENLGKDVGSSVKDVTEGVSKGTQRGVENVKDNTRNAGKDLREKADVTVKNASELAKDESYKGM